MKQKIAVAFSGGVDSTFSLIYLLEKGYDVRAFTFKIPGKTFDNAIEIALKLKVPLEFVDIQSIFEKIVQKNFIEEYKMGKTPNPCIRCNRFIKFGVLYYHILHNHNIELFSTGHYVQKEIKNSNLLLKKAYDTSKDQSYFLWGISHKLLPFLDFPCGRLKKEDIRSIVKSYNIKNLNIAKESFDICFIPDNDYKRYLEEKLHKNFPKHAHFVDTKGNILDESDGIINYTIGQRKGLKFAAGKRMYVRRIDPLKNEIELGDKPKTKRIVANKINLFVNPDYFEANKFYKCKIRYQSKEADAKVNYIRAGNHNKLLVEFNELQEASSKGQSLVIYEDDFLLAGGIIDEIEII